MWGLAAACKGLLFNAMATIELNQRLPFLKRKSRECWGVFFLPWGWYGRQLGVG